MKRRAIMLLVLLVLMVFIRCSFGLWLAPVLEFARPARRNDARVGQRLMRPRA